MQDEAAVQLLVRQNTLNCQGQANIKTTKLGKRKKKTKATYTERWFAT